MLRSESFALDTCRAILDFLQKEPQMYHSKITNTPKGCKLHIWGAYHRIDENLRVYFTQAGYLEEINQAADGVGGTQFVFKKANEICTSQAIWNYDGLNSLPPTKYELRIDCIK